LEEGGIEHRRWIVLQGQFEEVAQGVKDTYGQAAVREGVVVQVDVRKHGEAREEVVGDGRQVVVVEVDILQVGAEEAQAIGIVDVNVLADQSEVRAVHGDGGEVAAAVAEVAEDCHRVFAGP